MSNSQLLIWMFLSSNSANSVKCPNIIIRKVLFNLHTILQPMLRTSKFELNLQEQFRKKHICVSQCVT